MLDLSIYSLKQILFEGAALSVNLPTTTGEITVLANHVPLISSLKQGKIYIKNQNKEIIAIDIRGGFLEVRPKSQVVILAQI